MKFKAIVRFNDEEQAYLSDVGIFGLPEMDKDRIDNSIIQLEETIGLAKLEKSEAPPMQVSKDDPWDQVGASLVSGANASSLEKAEEALGVLMGARKILGAGNEALLYYSTVQSEGEEDGIATV